VLTASESSAPSRAATETQPVVRLIVRNVKSMRRKNALKNRCFQASAVFLKAYGCRREEDEKNDFGGPDEPHDRRVWRLADAMHNHPRTLTAESEVEAWELGIGSWEFLRLSAGDRPCLGLHVPVPFGHFQPAKRVS
jgi:hypothetical protein